jgi:hypothetical protein
LFFSIENSLKRKEFRAGAAKREILVVVKYLKVYYNKHKRGTIEETGEG